MKVRLGADIVGSYAFNAAAKTVTFSRLNDPIALDNILLITNVTRNIIIYNFADATRGEQSFSPTSTGTSFGGVLTLVLDTTAMANSDVLQIFFDMPTYNDSVQALLRRMNKILESNTVVDSRLRQKVVVEAIGNNLAAPTEAAGTIPVSGTVTVTGTVTATSNVNNAVTLTSLQNNPANPYGLLASQPSGVVTEGPVGQEWRVITESRNCYANSIRSRLSFT